MASVAAVIDTTKDSRWYFTADQLQQNSPSRKSGLDTDQELNHRQKAAYLIQDMGQRLRVSQLCINTAIVYMHRFYAFHSFTHFHRNGIAAASLFLAAKVEEQPRKIETIIQAANACLEAPDAIKENYQEQAQDLVFNENVLLQTLGFDVAVDHPHTYVVKTCHLVKACKDLGQTSYFLASNSLHLTTMCLQYRPPVVACFCIYLACKWSRWEIPQSTEGKYWFHYVDKSVTLEMLEQLTNEFLVIYEKSPARLKTKLNSCKGLGLNASKGGESQRQMSHGSSSRPPHSSSSSGDHSRSHGSGHHRSSHHHAKQLQPPGGKSSSSQQPIPKPVQSSSSSGVSSTTAGSCRPRPERQDRPMASHAEPHFSAPHRTAGSTKGPLPPLTRGNISDNATTSVVGSSTGPPIPQSTALHQQQRSSAGSHGPDSANYQKNRSIPQQPPDLQQRHSSKLEQRPPHGLKDQKPIDSKSSIKQQHNSYPNQSAPRIQQQQPPYQQPPNYNQAMASRGSQQHNTQSVHNIQKQQPNLVNESSYRHTTTDELSNPATTHNRQNSSPKHNSTKPPSIFSPEWNDKSVANNKTSSSGNGLNIKSNRDSPKKHERRSETPTKREKLQLDSPITPQSQKIQQHEKRSNSAKRLTDTPGMPTMHVPPPAISPFMDTMTNTALPATSINKPQPSLNVSIKRPHSDDLVKQEDGVDFREKKFMKLEPMSSPTSSKRWPLPSDTFGGITSINQQQSLTANNPFDILSKTTFNGIETNPDLVSSLLKESLCTDTKFTPFNNQQPLLQPPPQQQLNLPLHKIEAIKNESLLDDIDVNYLEKIVPIPQIKLESNVIEQEQRIKSEKKKKKEKHKHKDKEKSKDREERKKHKKDKERHKDRGGSGVGGGGGGSGATMHEHFAANNDTHNPIKITIPKDKLNLPSQDNMNQMSGFKITIPKDRIKTDVPLPPSTTSSQHQQQQQQQQHFHHNQNNQQQQPPPLKIKICKDVVMNTSGSNPNEVGVAHHNSSSGGGTHHSGGGGGSKKKDKDRERSGSGEHQKQNGNNRSNGGGGGGGSTAGGGHGSSRSGSQSSNSNKMQQQQQQHQYNNHSQQQQQQQYNNMYSNATVPPLGSAVPQQLLNHHSASALNNSNRVPSLTPAQLHQQQQSHNDKFINHHQFANSNNNYNNYYQQQQQLSNSNHNTNNGSSNKK